jgi:hypothetical protein
VKFRTANIHAFVVAMLIAGPAVAMPTMASPPREGARPAYPLKIDFNKDGGTPTAGQTVAIRRAAADDIKEFNHRGEQGYLVALADLNDDGRADLLVQYDDAAFCGSAGCSGVIVMATADGYARTAIGLPNFLGEIDVLSPMHHGMHDMKFGDSPVWQWNGKTYDVPKENLPGANAPAWQIRQASGHPMMAVATPIDSTIKNLLVFCEQGTPLLAMVTKVGRPAGPATLTFVFRGWSVNVPMQQNTQDIRLWVANLSRSDLPIWLAHRGSTSTTRKLARLADMSYLRINGVMEGQVSLKNSTTTTQTALANCYRY